MNMDRIFQFMSAASPWIAIGILLAIFFVRAANRKQDTEKKEDCSSEGMALGMCFGVALGTALQINTGFGLMAGMVLGLLIGSVIKKNDQ